VANYFFGPRSSRYICCSLRL